MGLTKYWNLYIFRRPDADEPGPVVRTEVEVQDVLRRFGLDARVAAPDDEAAVARALTEAPPLT